MEGGRLTVRLTVILALTLVSMLVIVGSLYNIQIVNGEKYLKQSVHKIQKKVTVPAFRGEILDRYGRPIVTNALKYNVAFETDVTRNADLGKFDLNGVICRLTGLMRETGKTWSDSLPITYAPYTMFENPTKIQQSRITRYLEQTEIPDADAGQIIQFMREKYRIDPKYNDQQVRDIAGVRYDLDLRQMFYDIPAYVFTEDVDIGTITVIKEQDYSGVAIVPVQVRKYNTTLAAHLLGRVGPILKETKEKYEALGYKMDAIVGIEGVEETLEKWLRGVSGERTLILNEEGRVTDVVETQETQPGGNCMLTIDLNLQETAERALDEHIHRLIREGNSSWGGFDARGGAVAVVDVRSGDTLALASYPTFNLATFSADYNVLSKDPLNPYYNRATMGVYAPGSTFKMCTGIAAIESGAMTVKTRVFDRHIYTYYAPGYTPKCLGYHGNTDVVNSLRVSCNYFFYEAGRLAGIDNLEKYGALLGLGQPTGIELAENKGILAGPVERKERGLGWYPGETLAAAIGQSDNAFSPLQLANYVATVANGGTRYKVNLLKSVKTYDYSGSIHETLPEVVDNVGMSEETHQAITSGMRLVAKAGTAANVFGSYPVEVAAKTGSAQVTKQKSDNGVFVAYAPYKNPEIAIAVVVERGGQGNRVAPIARDIFTAYFRQGGSVGQAVTEGRLLR